MLNASCGQFSAGVANSGVGNAAASRHFTNNSLVQSLRASKAVSCAVAVTSVKVEGLLETLVG